MEERASRKEEKGMEEKDGTITKEDGRATSTTVLSSPRGLSPGDELEPWCHARTLFSHDFGSSAVTLRAHDVALRFSATDLHSASRKSTMEALRAAKPLHDLCKRNSGVKRTVYASQQRQRLLRSMASLLVQIARETSHTSSANKIGLGQANRLPVSPLPGSFFGSVLLGTRAPQGAVPLVCLEEDFMCF